MNYENLKIPIKIISIITFFVSLIFTAKLLTSQGVNLSDRATFFGLSVSTEFAKIIFFCLALMLIVIIKNKWVWLGYSMLIIAICLSVLSSVATLGALRTENEKINEAALLNSDKYKALKDQIAGLDAQAKQLRATAAGQPSTWATHNEAIQSAQKIEQEKMKLYEELKTQKITGASAYDALYVGIANMFWGEPTEKQIIEVKNKVMSSYAILLEIISLFSALIALVGDYVFDTKSHVDKTYSPTQRINGGPKQKQFQKPLEMPIGFGDYSFRSDLTKDNHITDSELRAYIDAMYKDENGRFALNGSAKTAKMVHIGKEKGNDIRKILQEKNIIKVIDNDSYANVPKRECLKQLGLT